MKETARSPACTSTIITSDQTRTCLSTPGVAMRDERDNADVNESDLNDAKATLRDEIKITLGALSPEQLHTRSADACQKLLALEAIRRASTIMLYMPIPGEVDLTPAALWCFRYGKTVAVPTVDWKRRDMRLVEVTTFDDEFMDVDERGIRTPRDGRPLPADLVDVIVVPGRAFDTEGRRLGRGGGFYDRFLNRYADRPTLVGLAFDAQIVEHVPTAAHDIPMDFLVTERRTTTCHPTGHHH